MRLLFLACLVFAGCIAANLLHGDCDVTSGHDAISRGIVVPPIPNATNPTCCDACKANPECEAFVTGPCSAGDPVCKHWPDPTVNTCFLVHGYQGMKPSRDRSTGCIRKVPTPTTGWRAGWGFTAHGGLPPMPPNFQSRYLMNQSVVGYFVANNSGLASPVELSAEAKLGIMGIGWNLNHISTSKQGGLEKYEAEQAAALKKARPDIRVMVLRNTEVVSTFWSAFRAAINDTDLWLQSPPGSGNPISEPWGTDDPSSGGPTPKFFLNFSNPRTTSWWLDKYVGPALDQPNIDGIYTDCSCGNARGYTPTTAEYIGRQKAFDAALALAASKGKWFSAWTGDAVSAAPSSAKDCADIMDSLVSLGQNTSHAMQLQGWVSGWVMTVPKTTIAAFLIARGPSAVIVLPPYDRPMIKTPFILEGVDANADPGVPLTPGGRIGADSTIYTRSYTKAEVMLDCSNFNATIIFK